MKELSLDGIFVQIGLVPNTSWIGDAVELNNRGEVVIDRNNNTNVQVYLLLVTLPIRKINKLLFLWVQVPMRH